LAEVLKPVTGREFWPVDKVILTYFTATGLMDLACWKGMQDAPVWLTWHVVGIALLLYEIKRPNFTSWIFRNWYPLPYVASCYREVQSLIPPIRNATCDRWLDGLDVRIWHAHPSLWLEHIYSPWLTEYLQVVYTLFIPAVLWVAFLLWRRRDYRNFQYYAFLIALGFLTSYVGYILVPARGPRFLLKHLEHIPLQGTFLFQQMQSALDRLERVAYDCFPSGHTELTILAWWSSQRVSKRLFKVYFAYTPGLIFATVYLRYHYTVDVMAGAVLALILIAASPWLYDQLRDRV